MTLNSSSSVIAAITGVHAWVPPHVVTNQDLTRYIDTTDEWIYTRSGIRERRWLQDDSLASSDMGVEAVKGLLAKEPSRSNRLFINFRALPVALEGLIA